MTNLQKCTKMGGFGMKTYHLATLLRVPWNGSSLSEDAIIFFQLARD
jgi:hypothetical protein